MRGDVRCIEPHRPELVKTERLQVPADARLAEEGVAPTFNENCSPSDKTQQNAWNQDDNSNQEIEYPFRIVVGMAEGPRAGAVVLRRIRSSSTARVVSHQDRSGF